MRGKLRKLSGLVRDLGKAEGIACIFGRTRVNWERQVYLQLGCRWGVMDAANRIGAPRQALKTSGHFIQGGLDMEE